MFWPDTLTELQLHFIFWNDFSLCPWIICSLKVSRCFYWQEFLCWLEVETVAVWCGFTESWSWLPAVITTTVSKEQTEDVGSAFDCWVFLMPWFCWEMLWQFWKKLVNKKNEISGLFSWSLYFIGHAINVFSGFIVIIPAYKSIKWIRLVLLLKILYMWTTSPQPGEIWFVIYTEDRWVSIICSCVI